jgi:hypothetical protein
MGWLKKFEKIQKLESETARITIRDHFARITMIIIYSLSKWGAIFLWNILIIFFNAFQNMLLLAVDLSLKSEYSHSLICVSFEFLSLFQSYSNLFWNFQHGFLYLYFGYIRFNLWLDLKEIYFFFSWLCVFWFAISK